MYSYKGRAGRSWLLALIRQGEVGGVIFFSFNISGEGQIQRVIAEMIAANASLQHPARGYPLLLMTDQEGGEVRRLPGAPLHSEARTGASASPASQPAVAGAAPRAPPP